MAISKIIYKASAAAIPETWMDSTPATAAAEDITAPKTALLATGILTEGTGTGGGDIGISQDQDGYLVLSAGEQQPYVFYDWLKGDGNAFIDTGLDARVYGADSCEKTITFAMTSFSVSYYPHIMGARNTWGNTGFYICGETSASDTRFYVCLCNTEEVYTASSRDEIITIKMDNRKIYYNGTLVYTGTQDTVSVQYAMNILLFTSAMHENGSIGYGDYTINPPSPVKIYEFTVNDSQGDPVAHMVPAKRVSDDELGMYDTVRDVFYTNAAATGAFTIGND